MAVPGNSEQFKNQVPDFLSSDELLAYLNKNIRSLSSESDPNISARKNAVAQTLAICTLLREIRDIQLFVLKNSDERMYFDFLTNGVSGLAEDLEAAKLAKEVAEELNGNAE